MLKFIVLGLLVLAVILFFALRQTPRRPPRDWRRGGDDGGPILPGSIIGSDTGSRKHKHTPESERENETADAGSDSGSDGGGGGGGD
jgi:hypothetical protein